MGVFTIALAGNPNSGKTTLFNALTGSHQTVGNWPGVTVELKHGSYSFDGDTVNVVDLPGIYSLSARSLDEKIARDFIIDSRPGVVLNIVDGSNLERNLYLTVQLLEMRVPVVIALNMMDVVRERGTQLDIERLSARLGCTIIPISARSREGIVELRKTLAQAVRLKHVSSVPPEYSKAIETELRKVSAALEEPARFRNIEPRWLAIRMLEKSDHSREIIGDVSGTIDDSRARIEYESGQSADVAFVHGRYDAIAEILGGVIRNRKATRRSATDIVDSIVLNRLMSVPIFLAAMYLMFFVTIGVGGRFVGFMNHWAGVVFIDGTRMLLEAISAPAWLALFLADGVGGGLQLILSLAPPIGLMFLCLAVLEDSGYMARAAFVMDRRMRMLGLPGKAFVPMLVGLGCNVPAIMATRTLERKRDRLLSIVINPFMSCGARLPVFVFFALAFFPGSHTLVIFSLYLVGVLLAIVTGLVLNGTILRAPQPTFVMELPAYHLPGLRSVLLHAWERLKGFTIRAGKVILIIVLLMTALNAVGTDGTFGPANRPDSIVAAAGRKVIPVFGPMGISRDNWPAVVGLVSGLFAKEAIVGTLNSLYKHDPESGSAELAEHFDGPAAAYAYLLLVLIYSPCVATIAAIYRETNLRWTAFIIVYFTVLAWMIAVTFYQLATITRHPLPSMAWIGVFIAVYAGFVVALRRISPVCDTNFS